MHSGLAKAFAEVESRGQISCYSMFCRDHRQGVKHLQNIVRQIGFFWLDNHQIACFEKDFAFYSKSDVTHALKTGVLYVSYGNLSSPEGDFLVGMSVASCFSNQGLKVEWSGHGSERLRVLLRFEDLAYLWTMCGGNRALARFHRLRAVWAALRTGVMLSRRRRLELCFAAWACLPGGCMYKRAEAAFATVSSTVA